MTEASSRARRKQVDNAVHMNRIRIEESCLQPERSSARDALYGMAHAMRILGAAGLAVVFAASFILPPSGLGVSTCAFRNTFGISCPGCGLTRSFAAISHGQPADALRAHPLGAVIYAGMAVYMAKWVAEALLRRRLLARLEDRARLPVLWGLVLAMIGVWLCRLATGSLC